jgi:hypothetical protein
MNEAELQASVFAEIDLRANQDPCWRYIFHCPNGGHRDVRVAAKLKAQGVRRGIPDVLWPIPRGKFVGMAIELKANGNKTTNEQSEWLEWLTANGWFACVIHDDPETVMLALQWYYEGAES